MAELSSPSVFLPMGLVPVSPGQIISDVEEVLMVPVAGISIEAFGISWADITSKKFAPIQFGRQIRDVILATIASSDYLTRNTRVFVETVPNTGYTTFTQTLEFRFYFVRCTQSRSNTCDTPLALPQTRQATEFLGFLSRASRNGNLCAQRSDNEAFSCVVPEDSSTFQKEMLKMLDRFSSTKRGGSAQKGTTNRRPSFQGPARQRSGSTSSLGMSPALIPPMRSNELGDDITSTEENQANDGAGENTNQDDMAMTTFLKMHSSPKPQPIEKSRKRRRMAQAAYLNGLEELRTLTELRIAAHNYYYGVQSPKNPYLSSPLDYFSLASYFKGIWVTTVAKHGIAAQHIAENYHFDVNSKTLRFSSNVTPFIAEVENVSKMNHQNIYNMLLPRALDMYEDAHEKNGYSNLMLQCQYEQELENFPDAQRAVAHPRRLEEFGIPLQARIRCKNMIARALANPNRSDRENYCEGMWHLQRLLRDDAGDHLPNTIVQSARMTQTIAAARLAVVKEKHTDLSPLGHFVLSHCMIMDAEYVGNTHFLILQMWLTAVDVVSDEVEKRNIALVGPAAKGKSHAIEQVKHIVPEWALLDASSWTAHSLDYIDGNLIDRRVLVADEGIEGLEESHRNNNGGNASGDNCHSENDHQKRIWKELLSKGYHKRMVAQKSQDERGNSRMETVPYTTRANVAAFHLSNTDRMVGSVRDRFYSIHTGNLKVEAKAPLTMLKAYADTHKPDEQLHLIMQQMVAHCHLCIFAQDMGLNCSIDIRLAAHLISRVTQTLKRTSSVHITVRQIDHIIKLMRIYTLVRAVFTVFHTPVFATETGDPNDLTLEEKMEHVNRLCYITREDIVAAWGHFSAMFFEPATVDVMNAIKRDVLPMATFKNEAFHVRASKLFPSEVNRLVGKSLTPDTIRTIIKQLNIPPSTDSMRAVPAESFATWMECDENLMRAIRSIVKPSVMDPKVMCLDMDEYITFWLKAREERRNRQQRQHEKSQGKINPPLTNKNQQQQQQQYPHNSSHTSTEDGHEHYAVPMLEKNNTHITSSSRVNSVLPKPHEVLAMLTMMSVNPPDIPDKHKFLFTDVETERQELSVVVCKTVHANSSSQPSSNNNGNTSNNNYPGENNASDTMVTVAQMREKMGQTRFLIATHLWSLSGMTADKAQANVPEKLFDKFTLPGEKWIMCTPLRNKRKLVIPQVVETYHVPDKMFCFENIEYKTPQQRQQIAENKGIRGPPPSAMHALSSQSERPEPDVSESHPWIALDENFEILSWRLRQHAIATRRASTQQGTNNDHQLHTRYQWKKVLERWDQCRAKLPDTDKLSELASYPNDFIHPRKKIMSTHPVSPSQNRDSPCHEEDETNNDNNQTDMELDDILSGIDQLEQEYERGEHVSFDQEGNPRISTINASHIISSFRMFSNNKS